MLSNLDISMCNPNWFEVTQCWGQVEKDKFDDWSHFTISKVFTDIIKTAFFASLKYSVNWSLIASRHNVVDTFDDICMI